MKILYLIKTAPDRSTRRIIEVQSAGNEVTTVDLAAGRIDYDRLVADIFRHDRVICW